MTDTQAYLICSAFFLCLWLLFYSKHTEYRWLGMGGVLNIAAALLANLWHPDLIYLYAGSFVCYARGTLIIFRRYMK
ncbi:hypothetical protein HY491_02270 [Candidatus Woesearchaeota archaeon]|nr:hypothetical protein [Candidatus Woesearchaeota archaeon]